MYYGICMYAYRWNVFYLKLVHLALAANRSHYPAVSPPPHLRRPLRTLPDIHSIAAVPEPPRCLVIPAEAHHHLRATEY